MLDTQQKTKQLKNVAVAIIKNEEGKVLLIRPSYLEEESSATIWEFPSNIIIPGSTYNETFASDVLERTGCLIEAVSLISSEKAHASSLQYEYVECKIICKDSTFKKKSTSDNHKWVIPTKIKEFYRKRINKDVLQHLGL